MHDLYLWKHWYSNKLEDNIFLWWLFNNWINFQIIISRTFQTLSSPYLLYTCRTKFRVIEWLISSWYWVKLVLTLIPCLKQAKCFTYRILMDFWVWMRCYLSQSSLFINSQTLKADNKSIIIFRILLYFAHMCHRPIFFNFLDLLIYSYSVFYNSIWINSEAFLNNCNFSAQRCIPIVLFWSN